MTTYQRANEDVTNVVDAVMEKYHGELKQMRVRVDVLMATATDFKPAVSVNGYAAIAKVKIVSLKDRALGHGDAEIIIDDLEWHRMKPEQRVALVDHELYHLEIKRNRKTGQPERDDLNRPKLKMRKHDWQIGWFNAIAQRHGEMSVEIAQATQLKAENGQLYFGFAEPPTPDAATAKVMKELVSGVGSDLESIEISVSGPGRETKSVKIDQAAAKRIRKNADATIEKSKKRKATAA